MKTIVAAAAAAAIALLASSVASARTYDDVMKEAQEAYAAEDFSAASALLDEAQLQRPYSLYLIRNRVLTRLLAGRDDEAIAIAREIADRGLVLEMPAHEAFERMKTSPAFAPVAAKMEQNARPIGTGSVVFESAESGYLPEAINQCGDKILVGSVRTGAVLAIDGKEMREVARLDGGVFDIECAGGRIYAAVNNQLNYEKRGDAPAFGAIVELDRKTGQEQRRINAGDGGALLGDIEIDKKDRPLASDSLVPRIFAAGGEDAEILATDERFANLQGLAYDKKRNRLYLADYLTGLFFVDLTTNAVTQIANPTAAHLGGIDGLYLHKGDLIGVQNGTAPQRIVRVDLDKSGAVAEQLTALQQALPEWNEPTHGFVDDDEFVYIATSNWPAYDDEGKLREGAVLAPLRIMSAPLRD